MLHTLDFQMPINFYRGHSVKGKPAQQISTRTRKNFPNRSGHLLRQNSLCIAGLNPSSNHIQIFLHNSTSLGKKQPCANAHEVSNSCRDSNRHTFKKTNNCSGYLKKQPLGRSTVMARTICTMLSHSMRNQIKVCVRNDPPHGNKVGNYSSNEDPELDRQIALLVHSSVKYSHPA